VSAPEAPSTGGWFDADDRPSAPDLATCIHCGLCLTACPTYRTLRTEPDSPRGRLYLMRGLAEGRIAPSDPLVMHLDRCLDCRACESVCPAGVPYAHLLEQTRGQLERRWRRATPLRLLGRAVLRGVLPHRARVQWAADLLRLAQREPVARLARGLAARGLLPRAMTQGLELTPPIAPRARRGLAAAVLPAGARREHHREGLRFLPAGAARAVVAFHESCVMPALYPGLDHAALRLLLRAGLEVRVPAAATCCGALHAHAGMRDEARALARRNGAAFTDACVFVVSDSAGCGAALREGPHLAADDAGVRRLAERARDISEVLAHFDLPRPTRTLHAPGVPGRPLRVTYHDACHLAHAQRVREAPRRLLRALPGVDLVELPDSDWCCGSAGVYNLQQPQLAEAQLGPKLDRVAATEAHVVVASNPGCLLHMARGARARGLSVRHLHLVELLDEAFGAGA
jgi:glycolate oxidase iron-sulfur subunit